MRNLQNNLPSEQNKPTIRTRAAALKISLGAAFRGRRSPEVNDQPQYASLPEASAADRRDGVFPTAAQDPHDAGRGHPDESGRADAADGRAPQLEHDMGRHETFDTAAPIAEEMLASTILGRAMRAVGPDADLAAAAADLQRVEVTIAAIPTAPGQDLDDVPGYGTLDAEADRAVDVLARTPADGLIGLQAKAVAILADRFSIPSPEALEMAQSLARDVLGTSPAFTVTSQDPILPVIEDGRRLLSASREAFKLPDIGLDPHPDREDAQDDLWAHFRGPVSTTPPATARGCVALAQYAVEFREFQGVDIGDELLLILSSIARSPLLDITTRVEAPRRPRPAPDSPDALTQFEAACREHTRRTEFANGYPELKRTTLEWWTQDNLRKALEAGEIEPAECARLLQMASERELRLAQVEHDLDLGPLDVLAFASAHGAPPEGEAVEPDPTDWHNPPPGFMAYPAIDPQGFVIVREGLRLELERLHRIALAEYARKVGPDATEATRAHVRRELRLPLFEAATSSDDTAQAQTGSCLSQTRQWAIGQAATVNLSGLTILELHNLYNLFASAADGWNAASCLPWADGSLSAGEVVEREDERAAEIRDRIVAEINTKVPTESLEHGWRLETLIRHALLCEGSLQHAPELRAEITKAWGG